MKIEQFKGINGKHYFRVVSGNGRTLCSSQGYRRKANASIGIKSLIKGLASLETEIVDKY